jgi:hypothetical protein
LALPIFAITLFVSAFLLFLVQPMIGKLILPKLGGTPQVWNTCMVFFQTVLLLGYAYTHSLSTKLKLRQQLILHCALLVIPIGLMIWLPFYATVHDWSPPAGSNPIPQTLLLLVTVVGVPFFVVSTSAPLLQRWFSYSGDPAAKDPYFLYGASNLGSLLSLLFYPALVEPWTTLPMQSQIWLVGYVALAALIAYCAFRIYQVAPPDSVLAAEAAAAASVQASEPKPEIPPAPAPALETSTAVKAGPGPGGSRSIQRKKGMKHLPAKAAEEVYTKPAPAPVVLAGATAPMTWWRRVRWVLLAAVPVSLMLGVTSYISTDLSPFPLVWVVPLALYLLTFILVFMRIWTSRRFQILSTTGFTLHEMVLYVGQPLGLIVLCFIILSRGFSPFGYTIMAMLGFFATALACHGELAHDRPATRHLTEYFLLMSFGGAVGGIFNAIIAPILFQTGVWEFHIAVVVACMIRPQYVPSGWFDELIMNAFPGFRNWARNQGDEMAKSMGRPAPHTTYVFNLFLDVVFGVFIWSISAWLASTFNASTRAGDANLGSVLKFLNLPVSGGWPSVVHNILVYFIPLVFCFFFAGRPLRLSLAVAGLMIGNIYSSAETAPLEAKRTYFGVLRVREDTDFVRDPIENEMFREMPIKTKDGDLIAPPYPFTYLMHGTTYHGRNYYRNVDDDYKNNRVDLSRLATTYYHRYGPVGVVMEQQNWWSMPQSDPTKDRTYDATKLKEANPGAQNDFTGDLRMPVSLVGQITGALGVGHMPMLPVVVDAWSEPPLATIGLGTGTMASYPRPYGHMTYYEIDDQIRYFNLPEETGGGGKIKQARFTFLQNAIRRGVNLEVIMGDARQSLDPKREKNNYNNSFVFRGEFTKPNLGEKYPYADAMYNYRLEDQIKSAAPQREKYYKAINVDAFSSDAIPIHLVTKQAIEIYMSKLTDDGVLCVHTSNRHMDLVRPVARIALELGLNCRVGKDSDKGRFMGLFSSEYVMIYRGDGFTNYLKMLADKKKEFNKNFNEAAKNGDAGVKAARAAGVLMMRPSTRETASWGDAPPGWQILNSAVTWYNPFEEHLEFRGGQVVNRPINPNDSLWTDDYSYILGVLR